MLSFDHELVVNDDPHSPQLNEAQLWQGLLLKARQPQTFLPGLQLAEILADDAFGMERRLDFGEVVVSDRVILEPPLAIHFIIRSGADMAGASLSIEIRFDPLRLHFHYERPTAKAATLNVDAYLQSAYRDADEQMLTTFHRLALAGHLNGKRQTLPAETGHS